MQEQLISFETSALAKSKGFDWKCSNHWSTYNNSGELANFLRNEDNNLRNYNNYKFAYISNKKEELFSAPSQSILQRWLREVHKLEIHIEPAWDNIERTKRCYCSWVNYTKEEEDSGLEDELPEFFDTYELALESALIEALKLIK